MRRSSCDIGHRSTQGINCSTWYQWLNETENNDGDNTEKEEKGGSVQQSDGDTSYAISEVLRDKDEEKHIGRRRSTDWTMRDNSKRQYRDVSSNELFDNFSSTLSSICGDSISSQEMDVSNDSELVDSYEFDADGGHDEPVDNFEAEFENCIHEYARAIYIKPVSGVHKYISSVIVPHGPGGIHRAVQELETLIDRYPPRHWYIISSHGDHIHMSHICPNSNESCRCLWLQRSVAWAKFGKRKLRRITRAHTLEPVDYANVLRYLSKATRFVHRVGGFAEDARLCHRYKHLSFSPSRPSKASICRFKTSSAPSLYHLSSLANI
ncbi:hypothetical protein ACI65C_011606 [Semiaphis heraclei]